MPGSREDRLKSGTLISLAVHLKTEASTLARAARSRIGSVGVTSDILGNRLTMGSNSYGWDLLNRMTTYNSTTYAYRADGMRTYKSNSTGSTSYRYDGQMGMEDIDFAANGSVSKVTDYGIGARGIDAMYITQNGTTTPAYPIYDAHGNMISTLTKQGVGSYGFSAPRTYDAWGNIRIGAQSGDPKGRYCAKLGHKQDDESGLVYMRARYYEPVSGRFMSEDPKCDGLNWFSYCHNNPVCLSDSSGADAQTDFLYGAALSLAGAIFLIQGFTDGGGPLSKYFQGASIVIGAALVFAAAFYYGLGLADTPHLGPGEKETVSLLGKVAAACGALVGLVAAFAAGLKSASPLIQVCGGIAVTMFAASCCYFSECVGALICIDMGW